MSRITIHVEVPSTGKATSTVEAIGSPIEVFGLLGEATTNALSQNIQQLLPSVHPYQDEARCCVPVYLPG